MGRFSGTQRVFGLIWEEIEKMSENKHTNEDLKIMQNWSLERKIQVTQTRIIEWYNHYEGNVYISFSGGKDSTVLLDLVRRIYPDVVAVFSDTGLEYPEIREFVKSVNNVEWIKPKMNFKDVILNCGYPIISKEVSRDIAVAKNKPDGKTAQKFNKDSDYVKKYGDRWCLDKYSYLIDSPFKISNQCCNEMKKKPFEEYFKNNGKYPYIGTMTIESALRKKTWLEDGCNAFDNKKPASKPMSFWTEQDVLKYLKTFDIPYTLAYGEIEIDKDGKYYTTQLSRTGCIFCGFGILSDKNPNRFQKLKITHPKLWEYCMKPIEEGGLGMKTVLDYINIKTE